MQLKLEYTRVERVLLRAPQVFGDKQIYLKLCKKRGNSVQRYFLQIQALRKPSNLMHILPAVGTILFYL